MATPVVTRFAPSPTGFLHIGGARTALFNWLHARHHGGQMRLRIEDTDRARSTAEAIDAILDGLSWLGIDWDDDVVYQSQRAGRHREVVEELLAKGAAYRCYASAEELAEMRETARAAGRPPRYDGRWRDRDPAEAPPGVTPVIRIKAPREGRTVIADLVQGDVTFANRDLDDFVVLRSDGSPTYMLAVVADDHDMGITDIIRGDDHLTNAARQTIIYKALGWPVPKMAHIPLIHGPDGAKLSKRHGALGVDAYRRMGYLPAALRNYLVRLGWSHGDEEVFSTEAMIGKFDIARVGRSSARFDFRKLENLNGLYLRAMPDADVLTAVETLLPELEGGEAVLAKLHRGARERLRLAIPGLKERARTLVELIESATFLWAERPLSLDDKAAALLDAGARRHLTALAERLEDLDEWTKEDLEACVRTYSEDEGLKLGKIAQPLRAALTGAATSPPIFDVLLALGRRESLARIADQASPVRV